MKPLYRLPLLLLAFALGPACIHLPSTGDLPEARKKQIAAITNKISTSADKQAFLQKVITTTDAISGRELLAGNDVTLLVDGPATHRAQLDAINNAKHHVHLLVYLLTDDDLGMQYAAALREKAQQGVVVRLMYDGIGGIGLSPSYIRELKNAGVKTHAFHPINPFKEPRLWKLWHRNHRKLLVVDGEIGFTGGINITDDYKAASAAFGEDAQLIQSSGWRDTHVKITGPAVAELQRTFFANWGKHAKKITDEANYWPTLSGRGNNWVRVVAKRGRDVLDMLIDSRHVLKKALLNDSNPDDHEVYSAYLAAISAAKERVWITQAYFAPNRKFVKALKKAAARGVDVRILMPGESDVKIMVDAARYFYTDLLDAGIRLWEYQGSMMHSKTAVIDSVWATVGSSNLDYRSFLNNDEANVIVIGESFAQQMEALFETDANSAKEIMPCEWDKRSPIQRLHEYKAAALKYLL